MYVFSHSDILNFETNLFPIVPPAKINSCKSFNPKYLQQQKFYNVLWISREEVILDKRANLPKVKRTSEALKANIALPGIVRNEKKALLTGKKCFCKESENFFSLG